jgi:large subunit ribosomal protein L2
MGVVLSVFKVIYKTAFIAFIRYTNGSFSYISASHGMRVGQITNSFGTFNYNRTVQHLLVPGSIILLRLLTRYSIFSNLRVGGSPYAKYARSAGTYCQLIEKFEDYSLAVIKLPTGLSKIVSLESYVTLGRNSNIMNKYVVFGKAGLRRKSGHKPIVRGVARNPVDHPNGGRTKTNKPEKSLWG